MNMSWLILILVSITVIALIAFFIKRNQKDKKDLIQELIKDDEVSVEKDQDTEVDTTD